MGLLEWDARVGGLTAGPAEAEGGTTTCTDDDVDADMGTVILADVRASIDVDMGLVKMSEAPRTMEYECV